MLNNITTEFTLFVSRIDISNQYVILFLSLLVFNFIVFNCIEFFIGGVSDV
jgi:hypothetical protein